VGGCPEPKNAEKIFAVKVKKKLLESRYQKQVYANLNLVAKNA